MGQRLAVEIEKDNKLIATIYFQGSASTTEALKELRFITRNCLKQTNLKRDFLPALIHFLELNGGGIDGGENSKEWKYISKKYPNEKFFMKTPDRNYGLINISKKGMIDTQRVTDKIARIEIDTKQGIRSQRVHNFAYGDIYNSLADAKRDYKEWSGEKLNENDIPESPVDPQHMTWYDIDKVLVCARKAKKHSFLIKYKTSYYSIL